MKFKHTLTGIAACLVISLAAGCGKKAAPSMPEEAAQQELSSPEGFKAAADKIQTFIQQQNFEEARKALSEFDHVRLPADEQKTLDELKAKVPPQ